jgi:hypothetical protein
MSLKPLAMRDVVTSGFLPQAVISRSAESLARRLNVKFAQGHDDFDDYVGAAFALNGNTPFAIKRYQGHPRDTVTLYLPQEIRKLEDITALIATILSELDLDKAALSWQRADDPDL